MNESVTQPAFAWADLWWASVDHFTIHWFQLFIVIVSVSALVTFGGVWMVNAIRLWSLRRRNRAEVRQLIAEFEREDRAFRQRFEAASAGGKDAA